MKEQVALLISSDFPPVSGGQSRYLYDLWTCFPGEQVVVLAPAMEGAGKVDRELSCRVVRIPLPLGDGRLSKMIKAFKLLAQAWRICRRWPVATVHCGQVFSAGFAGWGCRLLAGVRYYPYVHGADLLEFKDRFLWGGLLRRILGNAEKVVVNSCFTGRAVTACGVESGRVLVVNPTIDLKRFAAPADRDELRRRRGWEELRVILSIGRLVERKGQDTVIRALSQVIEGAPQARYVVGGSGPDRHRLESLARELGVRERVEFLGFVSEEELPGLYAAADLFAMVSREVPEAGDVEGFGIVYLEANAAGTAVLAGRSGGVGDAVADGESGLLVDPGDVDAVARKLIRLLRDDDLRQRLGAQGRERVRRDFDRTRQSARLWEICR